MTVSGADSLLNEAIELHKKREFAGAIHAYEKFLKRASDHPGAMNLLGLAYFQNGDAARAAPILKRALSLRPDLPGGHYNLGTVLHGLKRYQEAIPHFEQALVINPQDAEAHNSLASTLGALGRNTEAMAHFEKAIALRPDYSAAHFNLAKLMLAAKDFDRAATHFRSALVRDARLLEAYFGLATALRELGLVDEALKVYEQAAVLGPQIPETHSQYGAALYDVGRYRDAIEELKKAIVLNPEMASAHFNLASSYYAMDQYDLACQYFQRAIALKLPPEDAIESELRIAWALKILGREQEAVQIFDRIITEHGDDPHGREAKKGKMVMCLSLGNFAEGWPLYEYRLGADAPNARATRGPRWNGKIVQGTLRVWGEEGLGDQILYSSMIDDLRPYAPSITLEVEPRLVDLFARSFPGIRVVAFDSELSQEPIEVQTSIANLAPYLRPDWTSFPKRERGYLAGDPARTAELRSRLTAGGEKVIGLSWRSASNPKWGRHKSAQLIDFMEVLCLPGVRFIDLQYGDTIDERVALERGTGITVARLEDIDNSNDIDGLAALISACDAVVTVSNTTAHLAGALGRPTWVFVPYGFARFWYWFTGIKYSPWYPRVLVNHQVRDQSWANLIASSAAEIADFLATPKKGAS